MRYVTLFLSLICMALTANSAQADRRVAFVVGNGAYKNVAPLPNPSIDAKAMAVALRNVGFEVVEGTNLTRDKMIHSALHPLLGSLLPVQSGVRHQKNRKQKHPSTESHPEL